jgi:hypothetical protein
MTTLAPPDPTRRRATPRYRPYSTFVDDAFDRSKTGSTERNLYRFLYKAFRIQQHGSPFSARAQVANTIMRVEKVKRVEKAKWSS